ncbi:hypothetical protein [Pedobacter heparinus]|uniref:Uncharacterized protein n=1 Tax=Pedobacter heparinus (strain ATCC 13125 / DSM 2366 / CIP 104194 / JCM 7457 / NBRC 12017 / NCIMB 9290 / NRRL B-14731 / HIM 762-3) TaxID=485917 RepID=C6XUS6_PEDHD|nr:hypothetical protein [Pedobacter heparinus]ACU03926.1 hypothetical protein Phep_1715 [Pedobacter heparinus DSM 2366]
MIIKGKQEGVIVGKNLKSDPTFVPGRTLFEACAHLAHKKGTFYEQATTKVLSSEQQGGK